MNRAIGVGVSNQPLFIYRPDEGAIYQSIRNGRAWLQPEQMRIEEANLYNSCEGLYISSDGKVLLLAMANTQNNSGSDIFVSFRLSENRWSKPLHCGAGLNTAYQEVTPFLAADNRTLYFASNRPEGKGSFDIYRAYRLDESWSNWSEPVSLGENVNTTGVEKSPCMPARADKIYFNRTENGTPSLYLAELPEPLQPDPVVMVRGMVQHQSTDWMMPATVQVQAGEAEQIEYMHTREDGSFQIIVPYGEDINLLADVDGYFPVSEPIKTRGEAEEGLDMDSAPLMASLAKDIAYASRDEEIRNLQLHLRVLDEEMLEIQRIREAHLKKIKEERGASVDRSLLTDPELDALRHRFNQHLNAQAAAARDTVPIDYNRQEMVEEEVEDMKTRYMRFYEHETAIQDAAMHAEEEKKYLWDEGRPSFEEVEEEVITELETGLRPKVERDLGSELIPEVAREVQASLSPLERQYVDLQPELLREQIKNSFDSPSSENWAVKSASPEADWEQDIRSDLKNQLEDEVKAELRAELKEEVKGQLKMDVAYWAKQETKKKVERELQLKLQQQMAAEAAVRKESNKTSAGKDKVQPLIPLPGLDASPGSYQEIEQNLLLVPAEVGMLIELNTVAFEPNSSQLKTEGLPGIEPRTGISV